MPACAHSLEGLIEALTCLHTHHDHVQRIWQCADNLPLPGADDDAEPQVRNIEADDGEGERQKDSVRYRLLQHDGDEQETGNTQHHRRNELQAQEVKWVQTERTTRRFEASGQAVDVSLRRQTTGAAQHTPPGRRDHALNKAELRGAGAKRILRGRRRTVFQIPVQLTVKLHGRARKATAYPEEHDRQADAESK